MRRLSMTMGFILILAVLLSISPTAHSQGDIQFRWPAPLNNGQQPQNQAILPSYTIMPTLPIPEPLIPGTLLFNIEDFSNGYRILSATLDSRLYAYNISYQYGIHPISPSGQYGIYTVPTGATDIITCGILDLLTNQTVDRFETTGGCHKSSVHWSPDSSKILLQTTDENGLSALGLRQNGQTSTIRPIPVGGVDLGGQSIIEERDYIATGWLSDSIITFEIGISGTLSEQLFTELSAPNSAHPITSLRLESIGKRLIISLPAQPLNLLNRGLWLTDLASGSHFELAPPGHLARSAAVSPNDDKVVYWAETETEIGTTHPLRLVIYEPDTDAQIPLLQFDGPIGLPLVTRPGEIVWNPEGIYFYISQQPGAVSLLQSGTYRIQPDGSNLEWVTSELLWDSLAP